MADGDRPREVSQEEFDEEFGLEGNAPHEPAYAPDEAGSEDEGGSSTATAKEPDLTEVDRAIQERRMFEGMDDNVELMEARREAAEAEEAEGAEEAEEGEEGPESEEEEEAPPEGEAEEEPEAEAEEAEEEEAEEGEAEEEEEEEAEEPEVAAWGEWLEDNVEEPDERQALFEELLTDDSVQIPYRVDGELKYESPEELVQKAAGYAGESEVTRRAQEVQERADELEQREQQLQSTQQELEAFQERLTTLIDDPDNFSDWLASRANLEYMEALAENLQNTVRTARENPELFTMRRELGGIKGLLNELVDGGPGRGAAPGEPGRAAAESGAGEGEAVPEDLNFEPGVGYPAPFHKIAHREVTSILRGAGTDEVSFQDVAAQWEEEGKKRPITDVALDLLQQRRDDSRKREIALDPPNRGRKARSKAGGGAPSDEGSSGSEGSGGPSPSEPEDWDSIQDKVERDVRRMQKEGQI